MIVDFIYIKLLLIVDYKCPDDQVKCRDNIECIYKSGLCNQYTSCNDGSDEDEDLCKGICMYKRSCRVFALIRWIFNNETSKNI